MLSKQCDRCHRDLSGSCHHFCHFSANLTKCRPDQKTYKHKSVMQTQRNCIIPLFAAIVSVLEIYCFLLLLCLWVEELAFTVNGATDKTAHSQQINTIKVIFRNNFHLSARYHTRNYHPFDHQPLREKKTHTSHTS